MPIDLRSDTVTRPTAAMREAMAAAPVGDDVYGEDPTVNALERKVAALMRPDAGPYLVSTVAVAVENTHNFGGGTVQPLADLQRLRTVADDAGLALHLDGARLWNAHVASGVELPAYGQLFDTVSVCLSKGLGAPVGSLLATTAERVAAARVWRKRLGGGMRQVGILAAAGLHALDHHVDRLADDHRRARRLAELLAEAAPGAVDPATVETNLVVVETDAAADIVAACREHGVLLSLLDRRHLRAVTHLDVGDDDVEQAASVLGPLVRRR